MKALTIDDHPLTRGGIEALLQRAFPGCRTWGVGTTLEGIELAAQIMPDLVLLDLHLPDLPSSADAIRAMRDHGLRSPIVIVTAFEDTRRIAACMSAGANGCLLKDSNTSVIAAALRRIIDGRSVLDPRLHPLPDAAPPEGPTVALTPREKQILGLVAEGLSNREIGAQIYLAESTVKWHVRQLMTKLDAGSRWQAVVHARERWLI